MSLLVQLQLKASTQKMVAIGIIVQPPQNHQQTAQWFHVKVLDNLLSRLASRFFISCEFFHFLQTKNIGSVEDDPNRPEYTS